MFWNFYKFASIIALWGIFAIGQSTFATDYRFGIDDQGNSVNYETMAETFFGHLAEIQDIDVDVASDLLVTTVNSASMLAVERNITRLSTATFERVHVINDPDIRRGQHIVRSTYGQAPSRSNSDLMPWFSQFGDFLHQKDKDSVPKFKSDSYAFILGLDKRMTQQSVIGVGIGGSWASVTSNKTQKGKANSFLAIGYGSYNIDDWIIAGNLGYASSEYLFSRNILGIVVDSQLDGDSFFGGLDISKKFRYNGLLDVMPFASLSFVTMSVDDYHDSLDAIKISSKGGDSILQTLGVRFAKTTRGDAGAIWTPGAYAAWVHDYENGDLRSTSTYFGALPITTIGAVKPNDRCAFGINTNIALKHLTLYGALDFEFASKYDSETIQGGISFAF